MSLTSTSTIARSGHWQLEMDWISSSILIKSKSLISGFAEQLCCFSCICRSQSLRNLAKTCSKAAPLYTFFGCSYLLFYTWFHIWCQDQENAFSILITASFFPYPPNLGRVLPIHRPLCYCALNLLFIKHLVSHTFAKFLSTLIISLS